MEHKPPPHDFLRRALANPGARCILGFGGDEPGAAETHLRVYPSLEDLTVYFLVAHDDIVDHEPSNDPVAPAAFLLKKEAQLTLYKTTEAGEDGNPLRGALTQTFKFGVADLGNLLPKSVHVYSCFNELVSSVLGVCVDGTRSHSGPSC